MADGVGGQFGGFFLGQGGFADVALAPAGRFSDQPCLASKNCSSSVEPFSAAVEALASMVVVTASK